MDYDRSVPPVDPAELRRIFDDMPERTPMDETWPRPLIRDRTAIAICGIIGVVGMLACINA